MKKNFIVNIKYKKISHHNQLQFVQKRVITNTITSAIEKDSHMETIYKCIVTNLELLR